VRAALCAGDDAVRVLHLDPTDGATGVFRDALVVASLSHVVEASSVTAEAFAVDDEEGAVPGRTSLSADGRCVVWRAARLLAPGVPHRVRIAGLKDRRGRTMAPLQSRFVPCDLTYRDVFD
jgi:Big-like domain-containing protein